MFPDENDLTEIIRRVAEEHKIVLNVGDPILIVYTMYAFLAEKEKEYRTAELNKYFNSLKEELEQTISMWESSTKDIASKVISTSLNKSNELISENTLDASNAIKEAISQEVLKIKNNLQKEYVNIRNICLISIVGSITTLFTCIILLFK